MATAKRSSSSLRDVFTGTLGKIGVLGVLGVGAVWAVPQIFAASNTVASSAVGEGTGTVSGYTASAIDYTLNGTNGSNIDSVAFTLNSAPPAGSSIKAKFVSSGSDWYTCTNVTTAVTCVTTSPQLTASAANELKLIVAD